MKNSRNIMARLDKLFAERDNLSNQTRSVTLSEANQKIIVEWLRKATEQSEFDRDVFTELVDHIQVKSRDNIIFILKDGSEIQADTDGIEV